MIKTLTKTAEEKKEYFQGLRKKWYEAKHASISEEDKMSYEVVAKQSPNGTVSLTGFYFTLCSMRSNGFAGLPYVDCKTYKAWKDSGFIVKKGEKSLIDGITWIVSSNNKKEETEEDTNLYPKAYKLFHRSQVQPL